MFFENFGWCSCPVAPLGCGPGQTFPFAWNIGQWQFCYIGHSQWSGQNEAEEAMVPPKPTC